MKTNKSYILQSFAILIMASGFFLFFKANLPDKLLSQTPLQGQHMVIDSLLLEAVHKQQLVGSAPIDSLATLPVVEKQSDSVAQLQAQELLVDVDPNFSGVDYLKNFYKQLMVLEQESAQQPQTKVRIAYFGDSMTDGDMIVQDLRAAYQKKYGGSGVGFVPITVESANSRASIVHRFSKNWKSQSYMNVKNPIRPFGISGMVFFNLDSIAPAWVSVKAGGLSTMRKLEQPTLYYGPSANAHAQAKFINAQMDTVSLSLNGKSLVNRKQLSSRGISELKLLFTQTDSTAIYGLDFASKAGVIVDNFSSRGNSGLPLSLLKPSVMLEFQKQLQYNLIVLHYGTNVLNYGSYNYSWYTRQMNRVVEHLKACFPNASILIVSTADKSTKYDLIMQTDSAVAPLVRAQKNYAASSHSGFFNLYQAMGGKGTMVSWVENEPAQANKDYTHFNYRGARKVAQMLFQQLELGYGQYKEKFAPAVDQVSTDTLKQINNIQTISVNDTLSEQ